MGEIPSISSPILCPYCSKPAEFVDSAEIYHGRSYGMLYLCRPCDAYVGCHPDGSPLGVLANKELRTWRKNAHACFDHFWKNEKPMSRSDAYTWLAEQMGIESKDGHIGMFNVDQCRKVIEVCNRAVAPSEDALGGYDLTIYFDGACEAKSAGSPGNPGGVATAGWIILDKAGGNIAQTAQFVKEGEGATNNIAEWTALGFALRWLKDNKNCKSKRLLIRGDSKLVICQLTDQWQVKAEHLAKYKARCLTLLQEMELASWAAEWIPRERNANADELSKQAYRERVGHDPPERPYRK